MPKLFRVVVTDFINDGLEPERGVLDGLAHVEALGAYREEDLRGRIENAHAVMLYHNLALTQQTIAALDDCRLIVRCGAGIDNVDHRFAAERGISVCNVPDYGTEEVADSALAMTLTLARGVSFLNSRLRAGLGPWSYQQVAPLARLRGQVFGIVGLGRIGTAAALRAKAIGLEVVYFDPYKPDGYDKALGVRRAASLDELCAQAHILSLHCPLSDETHHLINDAALSQMPRGSYLVNTARGGLVDPLAVLGALETGQLAGAGLDVLATEPPSADSPLVAAWRDPAHPAHHRLVLNPHSAFYSEAGLMDMRLKGAEACRKALLNQPLANVVNNVPWRDRTPPTP